MLKGHDNFVDALAYSRDGRTLLSGSDDHTAYLRDVSDPRHHRRLGRLECHTDVIPSAEFTPDGRMVVTAALDGTVRLWATANRSRPVERASLAALSGGLAAVLPLSAHACAHAPISRIQWSRHFPGLDYRPPCADRT
nr:hypothetical protein [Streptomyces chartreusis]